MIVKFRDAVFKKNSFWINLTYSVYFGCKNVIKIIRFVFFIYTLCLFFYSTIKAFLIDHLTIECIIMLF